MEIISSIVRNDLFIFVASISSVLGLVVALLVHSKVVKIKNYIDNSKNVEQKNAFGKNEATIK